MLRTIRRRPTGSGTPCQHNEPMNIFEALRISHVTQRTLADHLLQTAGDSTERTSLFKELKRELEAHAAAEERFFYVPLIAHDMTQEPSRHGIAEHHQMDKLVEQLEATDFNSPGWLLTAKALHHKVTTTLKTRSRACSSWRARCSARLKSCLWPRNTKANSSRSASRPESRAGQSRSRPVIACLAAIWPR